MNPYERVNVLVKRVAQLTDGAPPEIEDADHENPLATATAELDRGLLRVRSEAER